MDRPLGDEFDEDASLRVITSNSLQSSKYLKKNIILEKNLSFRLQVTEDFFFQPHNFFIIEKMTSFRNILGQSWNSEKIQFFPLFKKVLSNLEPEGHGHGIIKGVTRLLLPGPFDYIALYWGQ